MVYLAVLARFHARRPQTLYIVYIYIRRSLHCTHEVRAFVLSWRTQSQEKGRKRGRYTLRRSKREISRGRGTAASSNSPSTARHVGWSRPRFCQIRDYECARTRACPGVSRCNISQYNARRCDRAGKDRRYSTAERSSWLTPDDDDDDQVTL